MPRLLLSCLVLAAFCLAVNAFAAPAAPADHNGGKGGDAPISVEADHMTLLEKANSVLFTGAVDARQDDVRIRTDKMTVYYTPEAKGKSSKDDKTATGADSGPKRKVEKMVCVGNVEITRGDWLGTSNEMHYLAKERQVHLIGNAKAWQGRNMVRGDKIVYYIDEQRSEVVGDGKSGRVNMTIQ